MNEVNNDASQYKQSGSGEVNNDASQNEKVRLMDSVLLVVNVPVEHADAVRKAMHEAGAGKLGNYSHCSFSYRGVGRFMPDERAAPAIGKVGEIAAVEEVRIEVLCERSKLPAVVAAVKETHPYEEPAYHVVPIEIP
jgi:hypothetical protein